MTILLLKLFMEVLNMESEARENLRKSVCDALDILEESSEALTIVETDLYQQLLNVLHTIDRM